MFTQVKKLLERWSTIGTVGKGISTNVRVELIVSGEIFIKPIDINILNST